MIGESGSHAVCLAFLRGMCFLQQNVHVAGRGRGEMRCIGLFLGKHRPYKRRVLHATIHVVSRCYICIDALVQADGSS